VSTNFRIERTELGEAVVLALDGFLDAHTAPQFENAISSEVEAGHLHLVADCRKLSYISSAGLGVFMSFIEEIREKGGDIKLSGIEPKVYQVFEVLGFHELFDIVDTVEAAVALFDQVSKRKD
jgi:anti-sigma B factor antagonist